jgi:proline iminopeptidase
VNGSFFEPDQLLKGCEKIKDIPSKSCIHQQTYEVSHNPSARIVQGRYDLVCAPRGAVSINKRLTNSVLYWSAKAGHSAMVRSRTQNFDPLG